MELPCPSSQLAAELWGGHDSCMIELQDSIYVAQVCLFDQCFCIVLDTYSRHTQCHGLSCCALTGAFAEAQPSQLAL